MSRTIVIGAGAAGLMAAAVSSAQEILLIEKMPRPGRKLMITGKGRCNVTNRCDRDSLIRGVHHNGRFLYAASSAFDAESTVTFFENRGAPLKTERGNRVFPQSDKAVDIVDALVGAARENGARVIHASVRRILTEGGAAVGVLLDNGDVIPGDRILLATGGASYPLTGSTGDGYALAAQLGHTVIPIRPSLVPLEIQEGFCSSLSGLTLKNVVLSVEETGKKKPIFSELGEMLFTHFGVSGPLVLTASSYMDRMETGRYTLAVDLKPALTREQLDKRILRDFEKEPNRDFSNSLFGLLPKSLAPVMVRLTGIPGDTKVNQVSRTQRESLCGLLKRLPLHVVGFRPMEEAIITSGGVSVKEIDPKTMESRLVRHLYFAGEIIDVDAYTGGFNLQIAFSTGYVAGSQI